MGNSLGLRRVYPARRPGSIRLPRDGPHMRADPVGRDELVVGIPLPDHPRMHGAEPVEGADSQKPEAAAELVDLDGPGELGISRLERPAQSVSVKPHRPDGEPCPMPPGTFSPARKLVGTLIP